MGKQRAIKLNLNRTFTEKDYDIEDSLHIKDGESKIEFVPSCVFDEAESQATGKLKRLRRLAFLLPALLFFALGLNIGDPYGMLFLLEGFVSILAGAIAIAVSFLLSSRTGKRKIIMFVSGCIKAIQFKEDTTGLQIAWTEQEAKEYVQKQIALEQERYKVMKMWQFIVLIGLIVILLLVSLRIGSILGAF